jgi:hypothetical protein
MCPACIATSLALVAGSVTATGGLTALIVKAFQRKSNTVQAILTHEPKGERNESAIESSS